MFLASRADRPAAVAFSALLAADHFAEEALELALALCAPTRRRTGPASLVPAGATCELERPATTGSPCLAPAPGSVPGIDEGALGLTVYRALSGGRLSGRSLPGGARILVSRRFPGSGDLAVVATRRAIRVVATGPAGAVPLPPDGRLLGTVEGVVGEDRR